MSAEQESTDQLKPKTCPRCGDPLPPQKAGRPRRWCSQQCRQSAYEERHGLESWKDKQPKVNDLSDVVDVVQNRAARRAVALGPNTKGPASTHNCVGVVCSDHCYMAMVVDAVNDLIIDGKLPDTTAGRFLAEGVIRLVRTVLPIVVRGRTSTDAESQPRSDASVARP